MSLLENRWQVYVGIITEPTIKKNQRWFHIFVPELLPIKTGDVTAEDASTTVKLENVLTGKAEELNYNITSTIYADYFGLVSGLDVPTMYRGMQVLVLNYATGDKWYWVPLERDDSYKTFEHFRISCADEAVTNKTKPTKQQSESKIAQSALLSAMAAASSSAYSEETSNADGNSSLFSNIIKNSLFSSALQSSNISSGLSTQNNTSKNRAINGSTSQSSQSNKAEEWFFSDNRSNEDWFYGKGKSEYEWFYEDDPDDFKKIEFDDEDFKVESNVGTQMRNLSNMMNSALGISDDESAGDAGIEKDDIESRDATLTDDNTYYIEIDTKEKKHIKISTASTDGEEFRYFIEIDAQAHSIEIWDNCVDGSQPNNTFKIESRPDPATLGKITLQNASGNSIIMAGMDTTINIPRNLVVNIGGDTQFNNLGNVSSKIVQMFTSIITGNVSTTTGGMTNHLYYSDHVEAYYNNKSVTVKKIHSEQESIRKTITGSSSWANAGEWVLYTTNLTIVVSALAKYTINSLNAIINVFTGSVTGVTNFNAKEVLVNIKEAFVANAKSVAGSLIELIRSGGGHHGNH